MAKSKSSPKMKTRSGVSKRFKVTSSGKIRRRSSHHNHILEKKSPKRKRQHRRGAEVASADRPHIRRQLGI